MPDSRVCALIPARFQSTRLPGKPLLKIGGKTILQRTYQQTIKSKLIDDVYVVTDDDKIMAHLGTFGAKGIKIATDCLNGTERICLALDQIDEKYDIIVNVQGDEPFIDPNNIGLAIQKYQQHESDPQMVCTTIHTPLKNESDIYNKGIGKMIMDQNDNVLYCSRNVIPHTKSGQINPNVTYWGHVGIFVFRRNYLPKFLMAKNTPAQLSEDIEWLKILEMGYQIKSYPVENFEIGINTMDDFNYLSKKYAST